MSRHTVLDMTHSGKQTNMQLATDTNACTLFNSSQDISLQCLMELEHNDSLKAKYCISEF